MGEVYATHMNTERDAIAAFERQGFTDEMTASLGGILNAEACDGHDHPAAEVIVHDLARFEGTTDPSDESAVYAIELPCGAKGTWTVAFGPNMETADQDVARALPKRETN